MHSKIEKTSLYDFMLILLILSADYKYQKSAPRIDQSDIFCPRDKACFLFKR